MVKKRKSYLDRQMITVERELTGEELHLGYQVDLEKIKEQIDKLYEKEGPTAEIEFRQNYWDDNVIIAILFNRRLENDEEYEKRVALHKRYLKKQKEEKELYKKREYEIYLKLKEKYG